MYKIKKGDPALMDGYLISELEYHKIKSDTELLRWVSKKIDTICNVSQDERPNYKPVIHIE